MQTEGGLCCLLIAIFAVGAQEGPSCWWVQHKGLQGKGLRSAQSSDERGGAS